MSCQVLDLLCADGFHGVEIRKVISMTLGYFLDTTPQLSSHLYTSPNYIVSLFSFRESLKDLSSRDGLGSLSRSADRHVRSL